MGSEYIGNGYGQSRAGGCVGGVGCLADVHCPALHELHFEL